MRTTTIEIDIDVHRAIETRRTTFSQSQNAILREVLGLPEDTLKTQRLISSDPPGAPPYWNTCVRLTRGEIRGREYEGGLY